MKKPQKLYKYRSLSNFCMIRDILENKRLWASDFQDLNDPMEGVFYHGVGDFTKERIDKIFDEKKRTRVCSLSTDPESELMWTFYADNHRGIVIEVELDINEESKLCEVQYVEQNKFKVKDGNKIDAKYLLSRKLPDWGYEKEWRVLTDTEYVKVRVTGIRKGEKADPDNIKKLEELLKNSGYSIKIEDRAPIWLSSKTKPAK